MVDDNKTSQEETPQTEHQKERSTKVNIEGNVTESNVIFGSNNHIALTINRITQVVKNISLRDVIIYTFIFLGGFSLIIYLFWYNNLRYDRTIASAQLNVLIVPFVEKNIWGYQKSDLGWTVAQIFADGMQQSFVSSGINTSVKILGPADKVPSIWGFNENDLDREAERVAEKINGQIVVYGIISEDEYGDSIVNVKFYISPINFGEAQELISDSMMGELSLGSFRLTGETVSGADLLAQNKELRDRLEIFSSIINFLGAYVGEDFERAQLSIEIASMPELWGNSNGLEVIYLLKGNMEIRRARLILMEKNLKDVQQIIELARRDFNRSLDIAAKSGKGNYVRAYLGLSGVETLAAVAEANISGNTSFIDEKALEKAMYFLDEAGKANYVPETADVSAKVNYGKAQINLAYFAKFRANQYLIDAQKYYYLVVYEFENTNNKRISEFAALAYSGLGHIAVQLGQPDDAIKHFLSAQRITENPSLKIQCLVNVGDAYFSEKEYSKAIKYYEDALSRRNELENAISDEKISEIEGRIQWVKNGG